MSDRKILNNLLEKYGKDELLNVINEAFKSDRMRNYDDKIRKHNRGITDKAKADRLSRMDRLYKKYYDPENFDGDNNYLDYNVRSDNPETNRRRYETAASDIQYAFDRFMRDNKIDSLHSILNRYGLNFIDWHNVSDEDFIQVDKSKVRKYTRSWNFVVFWEYHDGNIFAITREKNVLYITRSLRTKGRWNTDNTKIKDLIEDGNVGGAIVLDVSKFDTSSLKTSRSNARRGMIDRTESQNDLIRKENINRYRRIIAQNNISKFDVIDRDVRSAVKKFAAFTSNDDADLNIVLKANKLVGELLSYYANFTEHRADLKKSSSADDNTGYPYGNYGTGEYHNEKVKHFSELIRQTLKKLNEII